MERFFPLFLLTQLTLVILFYTKIKKFPHPLKKIEYFLNLTTFDSYSSRSGEIFFNEIYKSSKQTNSQKTSQSILFMCRAKFGTNQLKSMKTPSMFSKIYRYFYISSCIYRRLHASGDSHEICFLSS